jgi:hypothetical protein
MFRFIFRQYIRQAFGIQGDRADYYVDRLLRFYSGLYWYLKLPLAMVFPLVLMASYLVDNQSHKKYAMPLLGLGFRYLDSFVVFLTYERAS